MEAQAIRAAALFVIVGGRIHPPKTFDADLRALDGTGSSAQVEEALRCLGEYLGLTSTRPEKEYDTGPDVLWICPGNTALCMDAKSDKEPTSVYKKDDFGQLADHVQWVRHNVPETEDIIPAFVGPELAASSSANPAPEVRLGSLEKFRAVAAALAVACRDAATSSTPGTLPAQLAEQLQRHGLLWPQLQSTLALHPFRN